MKKFLCTLGIGIAVLALPGVNSVQAADFVSRSVAVPFAFKVNNMTLPAGRYRVEQVIGKHYSYIVNLETGHRIPVMRSPVTDPNGKTTLTFEKTADGYKLATVS